GKIYAPTQPTSTYPDENWLKRYAFRILYLYAGGGWSISSFSGNAIDTERLSLVGLLPYEQFANRRKNATPLCPSVGRVWGKFCEQMAVKCAKAVIRNGRQKVVQGVVTESQWCRADRGDWPAAQSD